MQIIFLKKGEPVKCEVTPLILLVTEPQELQNIPFLEWGKRNKADAAQKFINIEGKKHEKPKSLFSDLHISKSSTYIGETHDKIFICTYCENQFCLEYKCPHSVRDKVSSAQKKLIVWKNQTVTYC